MHWFTLEGYNAHALCVADRKNIGISYWNSYFNDWTRHKRTHQKSLMDPNPLLINNIRINSNAFICWCNFLSLWGPIIMCSIKKKMNRLEKKPFPWITVQLWCCEKYSSFLAPMALRNQTVLCNLTELFDKWLFGQRRRPM